MDFLTDCVSICFVSVEHGEDKVIVLEGSRALGGQESCVLMT